MLKISEIKKWIVKNNIFVDIEKGLIFKNGVELGLIKKNSTLNRESRKIVHIGRKCISVMKIVAIESGLYAKIEEKEFKKYTEVKIDDNKGIGYKNLRLIKINELVKKQNDLRKKEKRYSKKFKTYKERVNFILKLLKENGYTIDLNEGKIYNIYNKGTGLEKNTKCLFRNLKTVIA